jgi:D-alanine-D-alanine ligase
MNVRRFLKGKTVGVLYGGTSAEREVSLRSGASVIRALKKEGIRVLPVDVGGDFLNVIRRAKMDIAYIALHGTFGEDGTLQAALETAGIPYTGSGVLASALAMDKLYAKEIFAFNGLKTPEWTGLTGWRTSAGKSVRLPGKFPLVVKPSAQGSTIGVSIVNNKKELERGIVGAMKYGGSVVVERYVPGKELTVGILGTGARAEALPVIEILPVFGEYYDYKAKYAPGGSRHLIPAGIPRSIYKRVQETAKKAFCVLGCRAVGRVDFRLTPKGEPYVIEVNTIPGMTETSLLPEAAHHAGYGFNELVLKIIEYSLE